MVELSHTERKSTRVGENLTDRLWRLVRELGVWRGAQGGRPGGVDQNLRRLDDRLLADIGLRRDQASGVVEELPDRLTAEPIRPVRAVCDRASALGSYRNLWQA